MVIMCGYLASVGARSLKSSTSKGFLLGFGIPYGWSENEYFGSWASILLEVQALFLRRAAPHQTMCDLASPLF